jgi:hypothetical protein
MTIKTNGAIASQKIKRRAQLQIEACLLFALSSERLKQFNP